MVKQEEIAKLFDFVVSIGTLCMECQAVRTTG